MFVELDLFSSTIEDERLVQKHRKLAQYDHIAPIIGIRKNRLLKVTYSHHLRFAKRWGLLARYNQCCKHKRAIPVYPTVG